MTVFDINLPCVFLRELAVKVWSWAFVSEWFIPVLTLVLEAECNMWFLSTAGVIPTCRKDILITVLCWDRLHFGRMTWLLMCCKELTITSELIAHLILQIFVTQTSWVLLWQKGSTHGLPHFARWVVGLLFLWCPPSNFLPAAMRCLLLKGSWRRCGGEEMTC